MKNDINEFYARRWTLVTVPRGTTPGDIHSWCATQSSPFGYQFVYGMEITERGEPVEYVSGVKFQSQSDAAMFKLTYEIVDA